MTVDRISVATLGVLALLLAGSSAEAQSSGRRISLDARGGVAVPTFDIADVADPGPSVGVGLRIPVSGRLSVLADADFGFHPGAEQPGGTDGPDVNVFHYMGKLAVNLLGENAGPWSFEVNAGAGAMTFDVDAPGVDPYTYFAINAGARLGYTPSPYVTLFLSPQGDIAFSDENEVGTDNSWVWPFSAGVQVNF